MNIDLSKGKSANMIKDIATKSNEETRKTTTRNIDISLIDKSDDNERIFNMDGRERLTNAIERNGFQGTVQVYLDKKTNRYVLLSGHRRFESAKELGYTDIPCEIIEEPSETQKAEILVMSNVVARDLTAVERGRAIKYYEENVLNKEGSVKDKRGELAKRFGIANSQVYKLKALADIIKPLQDLVENESINYASIYVCANLSEEIQEKIHKEIIEKLNRDGSILGKDVTEIVKKYSDKSKNTPKAEDTLKQANEENLDNDDDLALEDFNEISKESEREVSKPILEEPKAPLFSNRQLPENEFISPRLKQSATMPYEEVRISSNARNLYNILKDIKEIKNEEVLEGLKQLRNLLDGMNL